MGKAIEKIYEEALAELETASDAEAVKVISVRYLGRKGYLTKISEKHFENSSGRKATGRQESE